MALSSSSSRSVGSVLRSLTSSSADTDDSSSVLMRVAYVMTLGDSTCPVEDFKARSIIV